MELAAWGWDERWAEAWSAAAPTARSGPGAEAASERDEESLQPGRVTTRERTRWTVQTEDGFRQARVVTGARGPAVGDWIALRPGPSPDDPWSIEGILPRRSSFSRQAAGERTDEQVVAANVDTVWIVHGLDVAPNARRIERYLALAWESGARPEIVLTKADVAVDLEEARRLVESLAFGVPVHVVSVVAEGEAAGEADRPAGGGPGVDDGSDGLHALAERMVPGETVALLGPSGVGKSSLINRLAGEELLATGDVRAADRKGRHTTTRRELVRIESGALLLDTPGMRALQVWDLDEGLGQAFPEIEELAGRCRFRDCAHQAEPGCAVLEAVQAGALASERLASYHKLQSEAAYQRRKVDPLAKAEAVAEWKSIIKSLKHHPKYRKGR